MPAPFATLSEFRALLAALPAPDAGAVEAARARNMQLTKPPGALGRLEDLAIWYAGWRADPRPTLAHPQVIIFAGNHGVVAQGVSAFPAEVTVQMVANFEAGGAAVNQLAQAFGAEMSVVSLELERPTADFTTGPAMTEAEAVAALAAGWQAVNPAADLLVVGEMGIGNTTSAAAIAHALFGGTPGEWTGRGTGVDDAGLANKTRAVAAGVAANPARDPLQVLAALGGREVAAMAGAIARAHDLRIPVILDGFICTAAAGVLLANDRNALDHCLIGHESAEPGHRRLLAAMGKEPVVTLDMRLGEGSGAAVALLILRAALECHNGMATFAEAGIG